ncbi:molybdenum cofactor guanylyltransferase [Brachybacterium subflavum]|uniref:molybdenum cofactor guanylyltransferase n=1 Tax=Brachybacterium subflavum TaxID=2585206 RepID=UPI001266798F|nr:NTP transferase domain-containing protein [Brachybacterium subflavum]
MTATTALIVLGGGEGRRLGGVSKPDLVVGGRRLVDRVLDAGAGCAPRVVVAPESVAVPDGVLRTLEDPPAGGPVAGIAAGLARLRELEDGCAAGRVGGGIGEGRRTTRGAGTDVLILACDLPGAEGFISALRAARDGQRGRTPSAASRLEAGSGSVPDGVIAAHSDGRRELLAVLAGRGALEASIKDGGARDRSVRSLLAPLVLEPVTVPEVSMEDVDTWDQHAAWERRTSS